MITNATSKLFRLSNFKKSVLRGTHSFYPFVGPLSFINLMLTENHSVLSHVGPSAAITPGDRQSHVDRPNDSILSSPQLSSNGPQTFLILHTAFFTFPRSPSLFYPHPFPSLEVLPPMFGENGASCLPGMPPTQLCPYSSLSLPLRLTVEGSLPPD